MATCPKCGKKLSEGHETTNSMHTRTFRHLSCSCGYKGKIIMDNVHHGNYQRVIDVSYRYHRKGGATPPECIQ